LSKTKKDIAKEISKSLGINTLESKIFLDSFVNCIKENVKNKKVKILHFGTFEIHSSPQRVGRNPKTLKSYIITKRNKVKFRAHNKAKEILNWKVIGIFF